jgi:Bacterial PH domain
VTEADPIEVFRPPNRWTLLGGNLLRSGLILIGFFVVLYSSRPGHRVTCNCPLDHLSAWLWLLPAAAVGLVALTIEVWCVTQVQIYPDHLARRLLFRTHRYPWRDIANVYLGDPRYNGRPAPGRFGRPVPTLILADGSKVLLKEMGGLALVPYRETPRDLLRRLPPAHLERVRR